MNAPLDAASPPVTRHPVARLLLFLLLLTAGLALLIAVGADWREWAEMLTGLHPALFLLAMSVLPVIGFPISAFYFYAGVAYGWTVGIPLCLAALAINMSLSYLLAKTLLRAPLAELLRRKGHVLPAVRTATNQFRTTFLIRTVPGPPFPIQNYLLALAGIPFLIYFTVSLAAQGAIGSLVVISSGLLTLHLEPWQIITGAIVFFMAAGVTGSLFFKRREKQGAVCQGAET